MKRPPILRHLWIFIKKHRQWLGFIVMTVALFYAFLTVLYEPRHIIVDVFYGLFFFLLIAGLHHAFSTEIDAHHVLNIDALDFVFCALGVLATFSLVHWLGISAVLASASLGLVGYGVVRKYQVPIYCGSFAGMVSTSMFDFVEVGVLAAVAAVIFVLTKPLFAGYGGKLGTVAFMSSLITFSLFEKTQLTLTADYSLGLLFLVSALGVLASFYLQHGLKTSSVFASASTSLLFALVVTYGFVSLADYAVVFFSASFIGMSSKERLPNVLFVIVSGLVLGLIYFIFTAYFHGLGGKLGLMAMMSVVITNGIAFAFLKMKDIGLHNDQDVS